VSGRKRDTGALAVSTLVSGILAYVVFALITRGLGSAAAAPVSVLWSYWAFSGAALTFPVQHWITRSVPAHGEGSVRHALPRVWLAAAGGSVVMAALAWLAREPLFARDDAWFPLMVGLITFGSAAIGVNRGVLSSHQRFVAVGTSLIAENALRCAAVAVLYVAGSTSAGAYGLCLVAGHLSVLGWPSSLSLPDDGTTESTSSPFAFLAGAGLAQLINQVVLTGGPVLLTLTGGTRAQVTGLFAALALFRAPYMLALGVTPQVNSRVTRLVLAGHHKAVLRIQELLVVGSLAAAALAGVGAAWLGPDVLRLVFGATVTMDGAHAGILAVGSMLAVSNLALMVVALAQNRPAGVARAWVVSIAGAAVACLALIALDPLPRTIWTFLAAEAAAFAALVVVGARSRRPDEPPVA
jgi:O-antigen/teichoic acid export membrane protein